mgnify:FL=1
MLVLYRRCNGVADVISSAQVASLFQIANQHKLLGPTHALAFLIQYYCLNEAPSGGASLRVKKAYVCNIGELKSSVGQTRLNLTVILSCYLQLWWLTAARQELSQLDLESDYEGGAHRRLASVSLLQQPHALLQSQQVDDGGMQTLGQIAALDSTLGDVIQARATGPINCVGIKTLLCQCPAEPMQALIGYLWGTFLLELKRLIGQFLGRVHHMHPDSSACASPMAATAGATRARRSPLSLVLDHELEINHLVSLYRWLAMAHIGADSNIGDDFGGTEHRCAQYVANDSVRTASLLYLYELARVLKDDRSRHVVDSPAGVSATIDDAGSSTDACFGLMEYKHILQECVNTILQAYYLPTMEPSLVAPEVPTCASIVMSPAHGDVVETDQYISDHRRAWTEGSAGAMASTHAQVVLSAFVPGQEEVSHSIDIMCALVECLYDNKSDLCELFWLTWNSVLGSVNCPVPYSSEILSGLASHPLAQFVYVLSEKTFHAPSFLVRILSALICSQDTTHASLMFLTLREVTIVDYHGLNSLYYCGKTTRGDDAQEVSNWYDVSASIQLHERRREDDEAGDQRDRNSQNISYMSEVVMGKAVILADAELDSAANKWRRHIPFGSVAGYCSAKLSDEGVAIGLVDPRDCYTRYRAGPGMGVGSTPVCVVQWKNSRLSWFMNYLCSLEHSCNSSQQLLGEWNRTADRRDSRRGNGELGTAGLSTAEGELLCTCLSALEFMLLQFTCEDAGEDCDDSRSAGSMSEGRRLAGGEFMALCQLNWEMSQVIGILTKHGVVRDCAESGDDIAPDSGGYSLEDRSLLEHIWGMFQEKGMGLEAVAKDPRGFYERLLGLNNSKLTERLASTVVNELTSKLQMSPVANVAQWLTISCISPLLSSAYDVVMNRGGHDSAKLALATKVFLKCISMNRYLLRYHAPAEGADTEDRQQQPGYSAAYRDILRVTAQNPLNTYSESRGEDAMLPAISARLIQNVFERGQTATSNALALGPVPTQTMLPTNDMYGVELSTWCVSLLNVTRAVYSELKALYEYTAVAAMREMLAVFTQDPGGSSDSVSSVTRAMFREGLARMKSQQRPRSAYSDALVAVKDTDVDRFFSCFADEDETGSVMSLSVLAGILRNNVPPSTRGGTGTGDFDSNTRVLTHIHQLFSGYSTVCLQLDQCRQDLDSYSKGFVDLLHTVLTCYSTQMYGRIQHTAGHSLNGSVLIAALSMLRSLLTDIGHCSTLYDILPDIADISRPREPVTGYLLHKVCGDPVVLSTVLRGAMGVTLSTVEHIWSEKSAPQPSNATTSKDFWKDLLTKPGNQAPLVLTGRGGLSSGRVADTVFALPEVFAERGVVDSTDSRAAIARQEMLELSCVGLEVSLLLMSVIEVELSASRDDKAKSGADGGGRRRRCIAASRLNGYVVALNELLQSNLLQTMAPSLVGSGSFVWRGRAFALSLTTCFSAVAALMNCEATATGSGKTDISKLATMWVAAFCRLRGVYAVCSDTPTAVSMTSSDIDAAPLQVQKRVRVGVGAGTGTSPGPDDKGVSLPSIMNFIHESNRIAFCTCVAALIGGEIGASGSTSARTEAPELPAVEVAACALDILLILLQSEPNALNSLITTSSDGCSTDDDLLGAASTGSSSSTPQGLIMAALHTILLHMDGVSASAPLVGCKVMELLLSFCTGSVHHAIAHTELQLGAAVRSFQDSEGAWCCFDDCVTRLLKNSETWRRMTEPLFRDLSAPPSLRDSAIAPQPQGQSQSRSSVPRYCAQLVLHSLLLKLLALERYGSFYVISESFGNSTRKVVDSILLRAVDAHRFGSWAKHYMSYSFASGERRRVEGRLGRALDVFGIGAQLQDVRSSGGSQWNRTRLFASQAFSHFDASLVGHIVRGLGVAGFPTARGSRAALDMDLFDLNDMHDVNTAQLSLLCAWRVFLELFVLQTELKSNTQLQGLMATAQRGRAGSGGKDSRDSPTSSASSGRAGSGGKDSRDSPTSSASNSPQRERTRSRSGSGSNFSPVLRPRTGPHGGAPASPAGERSSGFDGDKRSYEIVIEVAKLVTSANLKALNNTSNIRALAEKTSLLSAMLHHQLREVKCRTVDPGSSLVVARDPTRVRLSGAKLNNLLDKLTEVLKALSVCKYAQERAVLTPVTDHDTGHLVLSGITSTVLACIVLLLRAIRDNEERDGLTDISVQFSESTSTADSSGAAGESNTGTDTGTAACSVWMHRRLDVMRRSMEILSAELGRTIPGCVRGGVASLFTTAGADTDKAESANPTPAGHIGSPSTLLSCVEILSLLMFEHHHHFTQGSVGTRTSAGSFGDVLLWRQELSSSRVISCVGTLFQHLAADSRLLVALTAEHSYGLGSCRGTDPFAVFWGTPIDKFSDSGGSGHAHSVDPSAFDSFRKKSQGQGGVNQGQSSSTKSPGASKFHRKPDISPTLKSGYVSPCKYAFHCLLTAMDTLLAFTLSCTEDSTPTTLATAAGFVSEEATLSGDILHLVLSSPLFRTYQTVLQNQDQDKVALYGCYCAYTGTKSIVNDCWARALQIIRHCIGSTMFPSHTVADAIHQYGYLLLLPLQHQHNQQENKKSGRVGPPELSEFSPYLFTLGSLEWTFASVQVWAAIMKRVHDHGDCDFAAAGPDLPRSLREDLVGRMKGIVGQFAYLLGDGTADADSVRGQRFIKEHLLLLSCDVTAMPVRTVSAVPFSVSGTGVTGGLAGSHPSTGLSKIHSRLHTPPPSPPPQSATAPNAQELLSALAASGVQVPYEVILARSWFVKIIGHCAEFLTNALVGSGVGTSGSDCFMPLLCVTDGTHSTEVIDTVMSGCHYRLPTSSEAAAGVGGLLISPYAIGERVYYVSPTLDGDIVLGEILESENPVGVQNAAGGGSRPSASSYSTQSRGEWIYTIRLVNDGTVERQVPGHLLIHHDSPPLISVSRYHEEFRHYRLEKNFPFPSNAAVRRGSACVSPDELFHCATGHVQGVLNYLFGPQPNILLSSHLSDATGSLIPGVLSAADLEKCTGQLLLLSLLNARLLVQSPAYDDTVGTQLVDLRNLVYKCCSVEGGAMPAARWMHKTSTDRGGGLSALVSTPAGGAAAALSPSWRSFCEFVLREVDDCLLPTLDFNTSTRFSQYCGPQQKRVDMVIIQSPGGQSRGSSGVRDNTPNNMS